MLLLGLTLQQPPSRIYSRGSFQRVH